MRNYRKEGKKVAEGTSFRFAAAVLEFNDF